MPKTIILMRHAKSNWSIPNEPDYNRTLNARGNVDAVEMGKRVLFKKIKLDAIVTSTATRALQTAKHVAAQTNTENIIYVSNLYHASPLTITENIYSLNDALNTILMVCHNPGITDWVNEQCGIIIENMPTAAMAAFTINIEHWRDFSIARKQLLYIDCPKKIK